MNSILSPRSHSRLIQWWWSIDRVALCIILALIAFGLVMVATASPSVATRVGLPSYHFVMRHVMFMVPALIALLGLSLVNPRHIPKIAIALFIAAVIGVITSLFFGSEIKGATRWIRLFGFSVQPSEFLKPSLIILSAWCLNRQRSDTSFPGFVAAMGIYGLSALLLLSQPDFGMFFLLTLVFAVQIFLIGCPLRYIFVLATAGFLAIGLAYISLSHVQSRIDRFLFPEGGDTYQIDRSREAFMNGGWIGTGPGQGTVKNRVPDVHSDFIFTAIGEEWGFLFTCLLVGIFGYLYYHLFMRFARTESLFTLLAGTGLTFMLVAQSFIHMGSALELIPAKGMTLPLISYGGSSLVAVCTAFGLILALSRGLNDDRKKRANWRYLLRQRD